MSQSVNAATQEGMARVILDVTNERVRQIEQEGFDANHDDGHVDGSIGLAAAAMAIQAVAPHAGLDIGISRGPTWVTVAWQGIVELIWPREWGLGWLKPEEPDRRLLVKAAALLIAEIERLDRAAAREKA